MVIEGETRGDDKGLIVGDKRGSNKDVVDNTRSTCARKSCVVSGMGELSNAIHDDEFMGLTKLKKESLVR